MCGIAGFFNYRSNSTDRAIIQRMTNALAHRGPDAEGLYQNGPLAFGQRRLSIIDLSEKSNQPIFDISRRFAIIFNGEIYNYKEVKAGLPEYDFQTSGDAEVILAAWISHGAASLNLLKGFFAFAIWDSLNQKLFIARDRMGVKPLYYYKDQQSFLFASEIRSILASDLAPRKLSRNALVDYLEFQSFQSPQTIVENIVELEAGCYLELSQKDFQLSRYWTVTQQNAGYDYGDRVSVLKKVKELLLQSIERRMVSDVPVAAFLSGGIDSSAVVGLMAEVSSAPETFTIAFEEKDFDESEYANLVAKKFKTRHHNILTKPELFLEELPNALNAMDSPSGDGINSYVVSKAVRDQGIKVALSGAGGDELFVGYPIFRQWNSIYQKRAFWKTPSFVRSSLATLLTSNDIKKNRIAALLRMNACTISNVYPILRQVNSEKAVQELLNYPVVQSQLHKTLLEQQDEVSKFPILSQISISEYMGYTKQTLLKDTDQMSMASALEVREPFFDTDLIEYVLGVPDSYKRGAMPKSLLVEALGTMIPAEIYQRPKKGFVFPCDKWFKKELRSYCESRIKNLSQRDFVNSANIIRYWNDFLAGNNQVRWTNILLLLALENYIELHRLD